MKCPHCDVKLEDYIINNMPVKKCPICFNFIIKKSELIKLNSLFTQLFDKVAESSKEDIPDYEDYFFTKSDVKIHISNLSNDTCIECGKRLKKITLSNKQSVEFMLCIQCNTVLISRSELQDLIIFLKEHSLHKKKIIEDSIITTNPLLRNIFYPLYNEITLYLVSLSLLYIFFVDGIYRKEILELNGGFVPLYFFGVILSIYHVFSDKVKGFFSKSILLIYIILFNFITNLYAFIYIWEHAHKWWLIIPCYNFFTSLLIAIRYDMEIIDERSISNRNADFSEVLIGSICLFIIIVFSKDVFGNYWAISLSLCIFYTINLHKLAMFLFYNIKKYIESFRGSHGD